MSTPAEQIARFIKAHPGEWRARYPGDIDGDAVLETTVGWLSLSVYGARIYVSASRHGPDESEFSASDDDRDAPILAQAAARFAELCRAYNVPTEGLPPWLADPVRRQLRTRAGELLTLAGSSPADVVSAAETVDEALCARAPVAPTFDAVVNALQAIGMSCRWIGGDPLILVGDYVYIRDDLPSVPIDDFAAFTEKHGERRMVKGDKSGAPAVLGYRVFMALVSVTP